MGLTVTISSITERSATVRASFTGGSTSYSDYRYLRFWIRILGTDAADTYTNYEFESTGYGGDSSSWREVITTCGAYDLEPDTEYEWAARVGEVVGGEIVWSDTATDSGTFTTATAEAEAPELWDWEATTARSEYYDILRCRSPAAEVDEEGSVTQFYLSRTVWNEMCSTVAAMRTYRGYDWDDTYLSLGETKMTSSDTAMSADRLNTLLVNVDSIVSTGLPTVARGDRVKGRYQIVVMEKCNQAIEEG